MAVYSNAWQMKCQPTPPTALTAEKIAQRMARICIGDKIGFDSMKECWTTAQVDRHGSTIKTVAPVVEHHGGYVGVRLHGGIIEYVNYFGIETVNGKRWPWYIDPKTDIGYKGNIVTKKSLW